MACTLVRVHFYSYRVIELPAAINDPRRPCCACGRAGTESFEDRTDRQLFVRARSDVAATFSCFVSE